jgi:predicted transcriptional regulator
VGWVGPTPGVRGQVILSLEAFSGLSQTVIAARMRTSQSAVARLESGEVDTKLSTVERFAAALGQRVEWRIAKAR